MMWSEEGLNQEDSKRTMPQKVWLDDLPNEILFNILERLSYTEIAEVSKVSVRFKGLSSAIIGNGLRHLSGVIMSKLKSYHLKRKPVLQSPIKREHVFYNYGYNYSLIVGINFLTFLQTEVEMFKSLVCFCYQDPSSWDIYFPSLGSLLDKFHSEFIRSWERSGWPIGFWFWVNTLEEIDRTSLPQSLLKFKTVPFATKVINILHALARSNFQAVIEANNGVFKVKYYFDHRGSSKYVYPPLVGTNHMSPSEREDLWVGYLRRFVRWSNAEYFYGLVDELPKMEKFLLDLIFFCTDDTSKVMDEIYEKAANPFQEAESSYESLGENCWRRTYRRVSTLNTFPNSVICKLELTSTNEWDLPVFVQNEMKTTRLDAPIHLNNLISDELQYDEKHISGDLGSWIRNIKFASSTSPSSTSNFEASFIYMYPDLSRTGEVARHCGLMF